jgi:hypothetical protein
MNAKKEELGKKLEQVLHVYMFAQDAYLYTEYFHNPSSKEELELVMNSPHSPELSVIMHLMFRTLVVETSKLFSRSDNDKFQLTKFIESLSSNGYFGDLGISKEQIEKWEYRLEKSNETINETLLLRDKIYAHTENPLADYSEIDISFKKIKHLLDLAKDIISNVYSELFDTGVIFDSPTFDKERFGILTLLAKAEAQRTKEIFDKYNFKAK